jgi:hypothetical protein
LRFPFVFGVNGLGGVLSICLKTSSSLRGFGMAGKPGSVRHPLPLNHLAAIGAIAATWTGIESSMELTILALYEIDLGRGLVLTSNLSFHARLSLLRILAGQPDVVDAVLSAEMNEVLNRVDQCYGDRNMVVHGLWGPTDKPGTIKRMSIRARGKKLQTLNEDYTPDQLWEIAGRLMVLAADLANLGTRLGLEERLSKAPRHSTASK